MCLLWIQHLNGEKICHLMWGANTNIYCYVKDIQSYLLEYRLMINLILSIPQNIIENYLAILAY